MKIRERLIEILRKYWWILLIIVGIGYFLTDIAIFKYIIYVVAIPLALIIFLPFIIQIFSPAFFLVKALIEHFREAEGMPFGKKYVFVPMALISAISFATAQMILSIWVFILSFAIWAAVIGFFWTFLLSFLFGLAPLTVLTAPFLFWYKAGFTEFIRVLTFFILAIFWLFFSKLAFSEDYSSTPEDFLGYSPQIFLLGALSFQVIAMPFYQFKLFEVGNIVSELIGGIFLFFALISAFKWRSLKNKLSEEDKEYLYKPSGWIYILGFFVTNFIYVGFRGLEVSTTVLFWLNGFFLVALIGRFLGLFRRKLKITDKSGDYYKDSSTDTEKDVYESKAFADLEQDFISDPPKTEELTVEKSIDEIKEEIAVKREIIADLSEEISSLKNELAMFEAEYHGRIGVLYIRLDESKLAMKEYRKRIELLRDRKVRNLVDLEKMIEEHFRSDYEKIKEEKGEAEQYSEKYEKVKEKPKLDEESEKRLKSLYRELAKKYHPDMARTPEEKERFHKIMAEINEAYNNKDLQKLEELAMKLKAPEKVFFKETLEEEFERSLKESEKLDEIISRLEDELTATRNSDTYKFKMRVDEAETEGRDLLQEMEDGLKAKIEQKEEELERVKQEFKNLAKDLA